MPEILGARELKRGKDIAEAIEREDVRSLAERGRFATKEELEKMVTDEFDAELVGTGGECVVIGKRGEPEKVVAVSYPEIETKKAKEVFYLHRIFSTLFPHNFPHFHLAAEIPEKEPDQGDTLVTVRRRIRGQPGSRLAIRGISGSPEGVKYSFKPVLDIRSELSLPVTIDQCSDNFALGSDGGVYFLDTLRLKGDSQWNLPAIMEYMDKAEEDGKPLYSKIDKRIVKRSIQRLGKLGLTQVIE